MSGGHKFEAAACVQRQTGFKYMSMCDSRSHFFLSSHSIRTCFFFLCYFLPWVGVATAKVAMGGASPHDDDALGKRQGKGGASCDSK